MKTYTDEQIKRLLSILHKAVGELDAYIEAEEILSRHILPQPAQPEFKPSWRDELAGRIAAGFATDVNAWRADSYQTMAIAAYGWADALIAEGKKVCTKLPQLKPPV